MSDVNIEINHDILLKVAKALIPGFKDSLGVCEGISTALLQAVATGPVQEKEFYDHIKFLSDYLSMPGKSAETLKNEIENVYKAKIIPESTPPLTEIQKKQARETLKKTLSSEDEEQEKKLTDLFAFFSTITLEHNIAQLRLFTAANQFDKAKIHQAVASSVLEQQGKFIHTNFIGLFNGKKKELSEYFFRVGMQLNSDQNTSNEKISFLISTIGHTVSLYFDKNNGGKWRFFDVGNINKKHYYHEISVSEPDALADLLFYEPDDVVYGDLPDGIISDVKDDEYPLSFIIRNVSTNGFDLALTKNIEQEKKLNKNFPQGGKIYLTEEGGYIFRDASNNIQEGNIVNTGVGISDLKSKILDFDFRKSILEIISKDSTVNVMDNPVLSSINESSNEFLFKTITPDDAVYRLNNAVETGQINLFEKLLCICGDNKFYFMLLLNEAVSIGNAVILKMLIKANNENSNKVDKSNYANYDNALNMALIKAAGSGHLECVKEMLTMGADKDAVFDVQFDIDDNLSSHHYSPLMAAAKFGHFEVVKFLLDLGVNKDSYYEYDSKKETALLRAVKNGHRDIVSLLINCGSIIPQEEISRAYSIAQAANQREIMKILKEVLAPIVNVKTTPDMIFTKPLPLVKTSVLKTDWKQNTHETLSKGTPSLKDAIDSNDTEKVHFLLSNVEISFTDELVAKLLNYISLKDNPESNISKVKQSDSYLIKGIRLFIPDNDKDFLQKVRPVFLLQEILQNQLKKTIVDSNPLFSKRMEIINKNIETMVSVLYTEANAQDLLNFDSQGNIQKKLDKWAKEVTVNTTAQPTPKLKPSKGS